MKKKKIIDESNNHKQYKINDLSDVYNVNQKDRNIFDGHDDHGHKEDKHKEDGHDDHGHDEDGHKEDGHDDHGHEGHAHGEYDPHIWLDPENAKIILNEMVEHLVENDEKNASTYKSNLDLSLIHI